MADKLKLCVVSTPMTVGGYDMVALNFQKNLDKEKFEITYCLHGEEIGALEKEAKENGARIIHQPDSTCNYFSSYFYYKNFFSEHNYDIVHSHLNFFSGIVMKAAYKSGVKKRIPHSHFTDPCIENRSFIKRIIASVYQSVMRIWLKKYSTNLVSCGKEAGEYLYGKKTFSERGELVNNGVFIDKFYYSEYNREEIRREFGLEEKTVLGHVGRLNYIKNHKFIVDIFYEFQKNHPDSALLIVGDGEQRENILNKAESLGIKDKVIITGIRNDVDKILSAMDCFVFPSLKEGFPLTLVEAQATKLACVISDSVTASANINSNVSYLSLGASAAEWAGEVEKLINIKRSEVDLSKLINEFDIRNCTRKMEEIYLS